MNQLLTSKNAVKYLLNTFPDIESDLFEGISKGTIFVREIYGKSRNVVIFVYPDIAEKNRYFVLKQVQKNDQSKQNSLKNEAIFFENNIVFGMIFCFFDNENFVLCYENTVAFQAVNYDVLEDSNFGRNLYLTIKDFSKNNLIIVDSNGQNTRYSKHKRFNILEDWQRLKSLMLQSDDISIIECINFITKYEETFFKISNKWNENINCICHGDVKIPNLLKYDGTFHFIDFELVVIANPLYDISSYIYNIFHINYVINPIDPTLHSSLVKEAIYELINAYSVDKKIKFEEVLTDVFLFFYIMLLENYINGTLKRVWVDNQQNDHYKRVLDFQNIIVEYPKTTFIQSLL